jgi:hypothetical protein
MSNNNDDDDGLGSSWHNFDFMAMTTNHGDAATTTSFQVVADEMINNNNCSRDNTTANNKNNSNNNNNDKLSTNITSDGRISIAAARVSEVVVGIDPSLSEENDTLQQCQQKCQVLGVKYSDLPLTQQSSFLTLCLASIHDSTTTTLLSSQ